MARSATQQARVPDTGAGQRVASRLVRIGDRLSLPPAVLLTQLEQIADSLPAGADEPASSLSEHDEKALREAGSLSYDLPPLAERASTLSGLRTAQLVTDALSSAEAATWLRVTPGRIRQRIAAGTLLAIQTSDGWRLPRFQFTETGVLRGLDRVLDALPEDVHPLTVARFLAAPSADLELDGEPTSPTQWLSGGGDIESVVALAADSHLLL